MLPGDKILKSIPTLSLQGSVLMILSNIWALWSNGQWALGFNKNSLMGAMNGCQECLMGAGPCAKLWHIVSFNPPNNPRREAPLLSPFYRWRNWGLLTITVMSAGNLGVGFQGSSTSFLCLSDKNLKGNNTHSRVVEESAKEFTVKTNYSARLQSGCSHHYRFFLLLSDDTECTPHCLHLASFIYYVLEAFRARTKRAF